jgi:uncharacterized membrane protein (UPF0127 family)
MTITRRGYWLVVGVVLLVLVAIFRGPAAGTCPIKLTTNLASSAGTSACVELEVADTPLEREIGLSKYTDIKPTKGMLFVFDQPQNACIWMKGMSFPIDILWLNADKRITRTERGIPPETYPETFCHNDTKYVIELVPGTIFVSDLKVGQRLKF